MSNTDVESTKQNVKYSKKLFGFRHIQFLLLFVTLIIFYGMRTVLSVAIISMTEANPPDPSIPTYPDWDNTDTILSSFYWGYMVTQVGAGQLSEYFGPKWFLVVTMIIGASFNAALPAIATTFGSEGVIVSRVILGMTQGFLYPSIHNLLMYGGSSLGMAISQPITGAIAGSKLGWPVAFYVYGGMGLIWALIFAALASNSPAVYKYISEEEKQYIESTNSVTHNIAKKIPTPWYSIATSLPAWAILVAGAGSCWGITTLLTNIPSYLSQIMDFDIKNNGFLSALPYLSMFLAGLVCSPVCDKIISKKVLSIGTTRKICNGICSFGPAVFLIWLSFIDKTQKNLGVVLLVLAVTCTAFGYCGYMVNIIDIAPNHAGTLFGIINGINSTFSILGPLAVGFFGSDKTDPILWRKVFLLASGLYAGCGLFYVIFATGEVQPWNDLTYNRNKIDKESPKNMQS